MLHVSPTVELIALAASVVVFLGTIVAVPVFFARIPADYFLRQDAHRLHVRLARNAIGVVLVALGIAMLVLPGPGVLTILVGLTLLDVPLKDRAVRWLLCHRRVKHVVDALRARAGNGPLIPPPPKAA